MTIPKNPRRYSRPLALGVGAATVVTFVVGLYLEAGDGALLYVPKIDPASLAFLVLWLLIPLTIAFGIAAITALLVGRLVGTTLTAVAAVALLGTLSITTYFGSRPIGRFRDLVWKDAPRSLVILEHQSFKSFSDGTTYTFVLAGEGPAIESLCRGAHLSKVSAAAARNDLLSSRFPDRESPPDTSYYEGDKVELAYVPSLKKAFIVCHPPPPTSHR